jgi:putative ABC transport system ATP-binding protein
MGRGYLRAMNPPSFIRSSSTRSDQGYTPGIPAAENQPDQGSSVRHSGTGPLVEIRDVAKSYREGGKDHVILSGASAALYGGEFVALLGPSGSGKSTLLNLVSGIDVPDRGSITVDGISLTEATERDRTLFRRTHIGFIFQFFNLLPTLTVEENLLLPLELTGTVGGSDREKARELLEQVGLSGREDTFPDRLSGGEQQRVAVARALIHDPALVLADEPTGNLDSRTGTRILDLLQSLALDRGAALLVVTHSRDVARAATRILQIEEGRLTEGAP